MRLGLCVVICLIAHSAFAVDFEVSQRGDFIVLTKEGGGIHVWTYAIRKSQISSVTLDKHGASHRIVIVTALTISGHDGPILKQYEIRADERQVIESAFSQILDLLSQKERDRKISNRAAGG